MIVREFIQLVEPFFVFYIESVTHGPRFIPQSVFYTQSVILSLPFIPEPVFNPVRSPQVFVLYLPMRKGGAQKMLNEYFDRECEWL